MKTLVVLPTHQEAGNIQQILSRLRTALPNAHVLVVDDASTDGTCQMVTDLARELGNIELMSRPTKKGLGDAYRAGFTWGLEHGFDILCEIDADLSHQPEVLPELVSAAVMGADLAIGSRYVPGGAIRGWPKNRLFLSRWGNRYVALLLGLAINDATSGFRAFRADAVRRFDLLSTSSNGYTFQVETTYRLVRGGARIVEIPIVFHERTVGASKMSGRIVREALLLVTLWGIRDVVRGRRASPTVITNEP